jgi:hypothetical protein
VDVQPLAHPEGVELAWRLRAPLEPESGQNK